MRPRPSTPVRVRPPLPPSPCRRRPLTSPSPCCGSKCQALALPVCSGPAGGGRILGHAWANQRATAFKSSRAGRRGFPPQSVSGLPSPYWQSARGWWLLSVPRTAQLAPCLPTATRCARRGWDSTRTHTAALRRLFFSILGWDRAGAAAADWASPCKMSDVRVSSSSPSVEWMDGRPAAAAAAAAEQLPKSSACRVLFGLYDRQEALRELEQQSRQGQEAFRQRWNFDPRLDRPLPGKMKWKQVPKDEVPDYYSRPFSSRKQQQPPPRAQPTDPNGNCAEDSHQPIAGHLLGTGDRDSSTTQEDCPGSARKRRSSSTEDSSTPPCKSSMSEADSAAGSTVEQTPRKTKPQQHQT